MGYTHTFMMLYHGRDETGSIEIASSSSGPWTKLTLTSTKTIPDALTEWSVLAEAALASDWVIYWDTPASNPIAAFSTSSANRYVRLSPCLAALLGFSLDHPYMVSDYVIDVGNHTAESDIDSLGMFGSDETNRFKVGVSFPLEVESSELTEYRAGRASVLHYGRASEVIVDFFVAAELWELTRESPLLSGHAAFWLYFDSTTDEFTEGELGGALLLFPLEALSIEQDSPDDYVWIRLRCTRRDEDDTGAVTVPDGMWEALAAGLPFGYGAYWLAVIEGWPTVQLEALADATAPSGYDLDATLVIDRTPRLGCGVDDESHIAKAFDQELRFLDSTSMRGYMASPARYTYLTADLGADDTDASVADTSAFDGLAEFYVGTSCIPFAGRARDSFTGLDRDAYGRRRSYKAGTLVTDAPYQFEGREVTLRAVFVDPSGRYCQGADILSDAPAMFAGYVVGKPYRDGTEWVMAVQDQVRRITDPIGVAASGQAIWTADDDQLLPVPKTMTIGLEVALLTTGTILSVRVAPFADMADTARASEMRAALVTALTAAATDAHVVRFAWRTFSVDGAPELLQHDLILVFNPDAGDTSVTSFFASVTPNGAAGIYQRDGLFTEPCADTVAEAEVRVGVSMRGRFTTAALTVVLDEGEPGEMPSSGWAVLEGSGQTDYVRYTALTPDDVDPTRALLTLDVASRPYGPEAVERVSTETQPPSVRFLWSDQGLLKDMLRRALASTGDAQNGSYDTLPKGQGLGLPNIDEDSFDEVFGAIDDLDFQIAVDSGTSIAELCDGLFRLSRRALVTRRQSGGAAVDIAAVDVGAIDTAVPVYEIDDHIVVSSQGRRPVRPLQVYAAPQAIKVTCRTIAAGDIAAGDGVINLRDPHLKQWTRQAWDLDVYGVKREQLRILATAWATGWFRAGETRQIVEVDVPPEYFAQPGDVVRLSLQDASLWDYAAGQPEYVGLGRVLGAWIAPRTHIVTLRVALDGILAAGPMSPSLPIVAVNGTATAPSSIDVDDAYLGLLEHALGDAASMKLLAYLPGQDAGRAEYTVTAVALSGGSARLTVSAYPSSPAVTLTTSYRLTWPVATECTEEQDLYLHNTDVVQWS